MSSLSSLSIIRFKRVFLHPEMDVSAQRQVLQALCTQVAAAATPGPDIEILNLLRNACVLLDKRDLNSICNSSAFIWTQLSEANSPALAGAVGKVCAALGR